MEDPVMDRCAHTFERRAIVEWIATCRCCPISRKPLSLEELVPNHILSERMDKWKWQREFHNDLEQQQQQQRLPGGEVGDETTSTTMSEDDDDDDDEYEYDSHDMDVDNDGNDDGDNGGGHHRRRRRRRGGLARKHLKSGGRFSKQRRPYELAKQPFSTSDPFLVPVELMLLPQEREALEAMYIRAEQMRRAQQRSRCLRTTLVSGIAVVILLFLSVGAAKLYSSNDSL
jgi:U-box domain